MLDPDGDGIAYFETIEERDKYAADCIQQYLNDAWSKEVTSVVAGVVTHSVQEIDRKDRPENLDEEGCDGEGIYWDSGCEYICNYKLLPVGA